MRYSERDRRELSEGDVDCIVELDGWELTKADVAWRRDESRRGVVEGGGGGREVSDVGVLHVVEGVDASGSPVAEDVGDHGPWCRVGSAEGGHRRSRNVRD